MATDRELMMRAMTALDMLVRQGECDMLLTGEDCRLGRGVVAELQAALASQQAAPAVQVEPEAPTLHAAAQAVLDRWNSPQWEWRMHGPTADLMHDLRAALGGSVAQEQPKEPQ